MQVVDKIPSNSNYLLRRFMAIACFGLMILTCVTSIFSDDAFAQEDGITTDPTSLDIVAAEHYSGGIERTIHILNGGSDIPNATILSTDLLEQGKEKSIPASDIRITPSTLSIPAGTMLSVNLSISPDKLEPGVYSGRLRLLTGPGNNPEIVPLNLSVHSAAHIAVILIATGVVANFLLRLARWKTDERRSTEEAITAAENLSFQLIDIDKATGSNYEDGEKLLKDAKKNFEEGKYTEAKKYAERAKNLFNIVLTSSNENSSRLDVAESSGPRRELFNPQVKPQVTLSSVLYDFRKSNYIVYAAVTVILAISLLQVWQQFFPQVNTFGASGISYITAFLFGYASEALLSEAVDFAKRV